LRELSEERRSYFGHLTYYNIQCIIPEYVRR
jgi:hypothetical protein